MTADQVHPEFAVERNSDGVLLHMPSVEFVAAGYDEAERLLEDALAVVRKGPAA